MIQVHGGGTQEVAHRVSSRSVSSVSSLLPQALWRGRPPRPVCPFHSESSPSPGAPGPSRSPRPGAGARHTSLLFSFCVPAFVKQDTCVGREVTSHHHSLSTLWPLCLPSSGPGAPWFCPQALQLPLKPLASALVSRELLSGHRVGWGIIGLAWLLDEADSGAERTRGPRLHPSWQRLFISVHLWFCVARPSNTTVQYPSAENMGFDVTGSC